MVTVTVSGGEDDIEIDEDGIGRWIEGRLNDTRNHFIRQMSRGGGGGEVYRRGGHSKRRSAPGEYPVTDGGRLVGSVNYQMNGTREGTVYSDVNYARYLTEGTVHMAERRMLREALDEVMANAPPLSPGFTHGQR